MKKENNYNNNIVV